MKKLFGLFVLWFVGTMNYAQNVIPGGQETIRLKGFVSFTAFMQDQSFKFGNGQKAEWTEIPVYDSNKWFNGFDIRNSRVTLVFNGPQKKGNNWSYGGILEMDFFGGYVGKSLFAPQMPVPRLRLAYVDLVHNQTRIRLGQAWTPMFGNVPVSLSHIAFPLGYGNAGFVGWRFPGIYIYQGIGSNNDDLKMRVDLAFFSGTWNGPGSNTNFLTGGNIAVPQTELRFNIASGGWSAYVVGHLDQKDLAPIESNKTMILKGSAFEVGAKYNDEGFLIQGNFYTGKNIGQQFGAITQVQNTVADLHSSGEWVQLGYVWDKKWGVYGFYGMDKVNKREALALFSNPRTQHVLTDLALKYNLDKQAAVSLEWLHSHLTYGPQDKTAQGNQISFNILYKF